jgi:Hemerythrin HHE cation binding domain
MLVEIIHQQHLQLRELFALHQEALLQGQFDNAISWLEKFYVCQKAHMQIEENYLFPEFTKIDRSSKWDVSLYEKEHKKIMHLHKSVADDLNWLSEQELDDSQRRRNIIALLDKEKTLKGLNEHHEDREEEAMLKELDAYMDVGGRAESGTEAERAKQYKELQMDIKLTWAEVIASIKEVQD